jgi:hypothetical protein
VVAAAAEKIESVKVEQDSLEREQLVREREREREREIRLQENGRRRIESSFACICQLLIPYCPFFLSAIFCFRQPL